MLEALECHLLPERAHAVKKLVDRRQSSYPQQAIRLHEYLLYSAGMCQSTVRPGKNAWIENSIYRSSVLLEEQKRSKTSNAKVKLQSSWHNDRDLPVAAETTVAAAAPPAGPKLSVSECLHSTLHQPLCPSPGPTWSFPHQQFRCHQSLYGRWDLQIHLKRATMIMDPEDALGRLRADEQSLWTTRMKYTMAHWITMTLRLPPCQI